MLSRLADLIDRRPRGVVAVVLVITAIAAVFGIHVREHLKPRGFDVPRSGSATSREVVARASGTHPADSVLALVRLPAPFGTPPARRTVADVEARLRRDPAVVAVLDAASDHNPAKNLAISLLCVICLVRGGAARSQSRLVRMRRASGGRLAHDSLRVHLNRHQEERWKTLPALGVAR